MEGDNEMVADLETKEMQNGPSGKKPMILTAVVVAALVVIAAVSYFASSNKKVATVPVYPTPTVLPTESAMGETSNVTPIQSSADLNNALTEVDNTDPSSSGTGLSQNSQDSAVFSQ